MLTRLGEAAPDRFAVLREELQSAWSARMRTFLESTGPNVVLLWFSPHLPSDAPWEARPGFLDREPLFVTRRMLDALRPSVRGVVMVQPRDGVVTDGGGLTMTQGAHREAAAALAETLRAMQPARVAA